MANKKTAERDQQKNAQKAAEDQRREERSGREWADEAASARTADDPRARPPHDAAGQPTTRPFEE